MSTLANPHHHLGSGTENDDPLLGRVIDDRYTIVSLLGAGGMGAVYKAVQTQLDREVALKVLRPGFAGSKDLAFVRRFCLEASITARLTHPNNVTIFDYGRTDDGILYIAMEYLEGRTLAEELRERGALSPERVVHVTLQIARAIRDAHKLGLVHRDLKPANVMLVPRDDDSDFVKVLDFGLAKFFGGAEIDQSITGTFLGSPHYIAPEQARHERPTPQSDVYSLGVMAYQMATGRLPFEAESSIAVVLEHLNSTPKRPRLIAPGITDALEAVILKAMAKDLDTRYASMDELVDALEETSSEPAAPKQRVLLAPKDVRAIEDGPTIRKRWLAAAIAVLGAAAAAWELL